MHDRSGECQTLFLSTGQGAGQLLAQFAEVVLLEQIRKAGFRLLPGQAINGGEEFEVLGDAQILVKRKLLRHVTDAALDRLSLRRERMTEYGHATLARREQAAKHADRRRLAATIRPEETVDLGTPHAQV